VIFKSQHIDNFGSPFGQIRNNNLNKSCYAKRRCKIMEMILLLVSWRAIILCSAFLRFFVLERLFSFRNNPSVTATPCHLPLHRGGIKVRTYRHCFKVLLTSNLYHYVRTNPRLLCVKGAVMRMHD